MIGPPPATRAVLDLMRPFCPSPVLDIADVSQLPGNGAGTVILQEIGQLTRPQQRALTTWTEFTGRRWSLLTSSPLPLLPCVGRGEFSGDLYYRLNIVTIDCQEVEL